MRILAIESSHDDTSIAVYENKKVLHEITWSQTEFHKKFGGTVPEYAARKHAVSICQVLVEIEKEIDLKTIERVAYTEKPGLIGSLNVGKVFAHALAYSLNVPIDPVHHMHGHIFSAFFKGDAKFPAIALMTSGGHTQLWKIDSPFEKDIKVIGTTKDDAIGEVFDKVARKLKLGFPGGPIIDKLAQKGENTINFKINITNDFDFSFSGIKTKVINYIHKQNQTNKEIVLEDLAKSFQDAIFEPLIEKTKMAIEEFKPKTLILGGGVSANTQLRSEFEKLHENTLIPDMKYTTDNASMIAIASDIMNSYKG